MTSYHDYENQISLARYRFAEDPAISKLMEGELEPSVMLLFLIHFSSLGVAMTEPVSRWIFSAGKRCQEIGLNSLGKALINHSRHEEGHHLMMIEDVYTLIESSRTNFSHLALNSQTFLNQPSTPGVTQYRELHEEVIRSSAPYRQIAIEYEIENLSLVYGARLIQTSARLLGDQIISGLSFIRDHVKFDVGHTKFNQKELNGILAENPEFLEPLVDTGSRALDAYRAFLNDCVSLAKDQIRHNQ